MWRATTSKPASRARGWITGAEAAVLLAGGYFWCHNQPELTTARTLACSEWGGSRFCCQRPQAPEQSPIVVSVGAALTARPAGRYRRRYQRDLPSYVELLTREGGLPRRSVLAGIGCPLGRLRSDIRSPASSSTAAIPSTGALDDESWWGWLAGVRRRGNRGAVRTAEHHERPDPNSRRPPAGTPRLLTPAADAGC